MNNNKIINEFKKFRSELIFNDGSKNFFFFYYKYEF